MGRVNHLKCSSPDSLAAQFVRRAITAQIKVDDIQKVKPLAVLNVTETQKCLRVDAII